MDRLSTTMAEDWAIPPGLPEYVSADFNLFGRLARVAAQSPDHNVIVQNGSVLTYRELLRRAADFGAQLAEAGIRPTDRVAVLLGNTPDFLTAAFGIWKRGAAVVPLNPLLQAAEIRKYLSGLSVRAFVTTPQTRAVAEDIREKGSNIDHLWLCPPNDNEWLHEGPTGSPAALAPSPSAELMCQRDWPAITQHSTGSTGYPKRITRTHAQLLGEFDSVSRFLGVTRGDRTVGVAPFFHSHGLMNSAMLTLLSGGTLYPIESFFARDAARLIDEHRITIFPGVPFMFQLLAELRESHDFSHLRCAISAGAPLLPETERLFKKVYGLGIRQLYGSTETGVICLQSAQDASLDPRCVGRPIPGVSVRVLDESGLEVPRGCQGRIHISSPFIASGYENAHSNSESGFDRDGFFPGDLGRIEPGGEVVLSGRYRGFINVSGNKVDPSEVELILRELPQVSEAIVFGVPDGAAGEKIKAVLVADGMTQREVRAYCQRRLAEFKHPRIIELRRELPRSPLGKVLRKYLMDETMGEAYADWLESEIGTHVFSHQDTRDGEPFRLSTLPSFLRVLLITDGTVTRTLAAHWGEPIDVEVLLHSEIRSASAYSELGVKEGDPILRRCATLKGAVTKSIYAFAESVVVLAAISPEIRRRIIEERQGIAALLCANAVETFRELLQIRRAHADGWANPLGVAEDTRVAVRKYRVFHEGRAAFLVEEVFPEIRFQADPGDLSTARLSATDT